MKNYLFFCIFLQLIYITFSFVPLWNFENSAIDLLNDNNSHEYNIVDRTLHDNFHFTLTKKISKTGNNIKISKTLYLYDNGNLFYTIYDCDWEDIESAYKNSQKNFYICPKGKFHPILYQINYNNNEYDRIELKPDDFNYNGDWELKCFLQRNKNLIMVSYLNSGQKLYLLDLFGGYVDQHEIEQGIFDYKWTDDNKEDKFVMYPILLKNNQIIIKKINIGIPGNVKKFNIEEIDGKEKTIEEKTKSNYNLFFNYDNSNFYWINYNDNKNFSTGFSDNIKDIFQYNNIDNFRINNNEGSPLDFLDKITIKKMNFIPYTKYVYYEIYNENEKVTYHGIIDITLNQVIFNTNIPIDTFIPYSSNSMLAINKISAYKICAIKDDNNECVDECSNGKAIYDVNNSNQCKESNYKCPKYALFQNYICIDSCDENILTLKDNKCGYCKDLYPYDKPYKLINTNGCVKGNIEGTEIINEELKLLNCSKGYNLFDGKCQKSGDSGDCYKNCETCSGPSQSSENQKCISCKEKYFLHEGNCLEKCPDGFFKEDKKCNVCKEPCKTCDISANNCKSCINHFYFNKTEKKCYNCHENCETCSKGEEGENENCLSCNKSSDFKYLVKAKGFYSNCVKQCPNNTIESSSECVDEIKNKDFLLYIYIVIIGMLLLFVIILFFIKNCKKNEDENLIKEIHTELVENKGLSQ